MRTARRFGYEISAMWRTARTSSARSRA
jgi:hypothetical protein